MLWAMGFVHGLGNGLGAGPADASLCRSCVVGIVAVDARHSLETFVFRQPQIHKGDRPWLRSPQRP
jgi:hypothetical protein